MNFMIDKLKPGDAKEILDYIKLIGAESDNLSFGPEGLPVSVEAEYEYIQSVLDSKNSAMLVAKKDGKIIGDCSISALSRRFSHRGELGISVAKDYWNLGIGAALLEKSLYIAKNELGLEVISLEVRTDNEAAIHLYKKYGFRYMGTYEKFFKIGENYFDADFMNLYF